MAEEAERPPPAITGALGSEAQTQVRLARIETRLDGIEHRIDHVVDLLGGRGRLTERCMTTLLAVVNGPNMRWIALTLIGCAALATGASLSGYGITIGTITEAVTHANEAPDGADNAP